MLKKLFYPFIRIGRWIKDTAWIQPLLIVGLVFAVIFCISPIVKACGQKNNKEDFMFYEERRLSLENIFEDETKCQAYELLNNIYEANTLFKDGGYDAAKEIINKLPAEKFFLDFYGYGDGKAPCAACGENSEAFKYLNEHWNKETYFTPAKEGEKLVITCIDTLQIVKNVEKDKEEAGFPELLNKIPEFFESTATGIEELPYYVKGNGKSETSNLTNFRECNKSSFPAPTLMLVDFTNKEAKSGIGQLVFSISGKGNGTGAADKAMTLMDCWNGKGDFSFDQASE